MKIPSIISNAAQSLNASYVQAKNWAHRTASSITAKDVAKYTALAAAAFAGAYLLYTYARQSSPETMCSLEARPADAEKAILGNCSLLDRPVGLPLSENVGQPAFLSSLANSPTPTEVSSSLVKAPLSQIALPAPKVKFSNLTSGLRGETCQDSTLSRLYAVMANSLSTI